ncbi:MAG: exodeoxyribonuclease large subunit [Bacteroidota bacterium]
MQEEPLSVSQLTHTIKGIIESGIGEVSVVGEVSNYKHHSSGHHYFTLKDSGSQLPCVMWRSRTLTFRPEDGMRVVARGKVTVYAVQGKYQLDCTAMQPEGVGDLYVAFEQLKRDLAQRGFFDAANKRPLPRMPLRVGIATSETGAAVRDMLSTIERRFPVLQVVLRPTIVQGEGSAADIAAAIKDLEHAQVDVMIIGRGGGSIEDLWAFNTLEVATAVYACSVPIISAVGHETDTTISDFVADVRAATPTAAAELVTAITSADIMYSIDLAADAMTNSIQERLEHLSELAASFMDGRALRRVIERIMIRKQRIDDLKARITRTTRHAISARLRDIDHFGSRLSSLHPLAPLARGYAVLERDGKPLGAGQNLAAGDAVQIRRSSEISDVIVQSVRPTTTPQQQP